MDITTSLATSRLMAQQRAMDVTANNIANASTPGYRTERIEFSEWLDQQTNTAAVPGGRTITYTQDRATYRETAPGTLTHTANPFDLALAGDGYFTVNTKSGPRLTRAGRFGTLPDGTVSDDNGDPVLDTTGKPIRISPTDTEISVAGDGSISSENGPIAKIGVVQPADPMQLQAEGSSNFVANSPTTPVTKPNVVQGAIESSNVQPVLEISRMIDNERQFQLVIQFVQAEGDRKQQTIDKLLPTGTGS